MSNWPTKPVELDHLQAMGILMALYAEEARDGLSGPQREAKDKVEDVCGDLMAGLRRGSAS